MNEHANKLLKFAFSGVVYLLLKFDIFADILWGIASILAMFKVINNSADVFLILENWLYVLVLLTLRVIAVIAITYYGITAGIDLFSNKDKKTE